MTAKVIWLIAFLVPLPSFSSDTSKSPSTADKYIRAVQTFADQVLAHGRDVYGPKHTPLFIDGLNIDTLEPMKWKTQGREWVISDLGNQQILFRTLDGLSNLTGEPKYRRLPKKPPVMRSPTCVKEAF